MRREPHSPLPDCQTNLQVCLEPFEVPDLRAIRISRRNRFPDRPRTDTGSRQRPALSAQANEPDMNSSPVFVHHAFHRPPNQVKPRELPDHRRETGAFGHVDQAAPQATGFREAENRDVLRAGISSLISSPAMRFPTSRERLPVPDDTAAQSREPKPVVRSTDHSTAFHQPVDRLHPPGCRIRP